MTMTGGDGGDAELALSAASRSQLLRVAQSSMKLMQRELADKAQRIQSLLEALRRQQARYELQVRQLMQERRQREEEEEGRQQQVLLELRQAVQRLQASDAPSLPHDAVHRDELQRRVEEKDRQLEAALREALTLQLLVHEVREQRRGSEQALQAELAERDTTIAQLQEALAQVRHAFRMSGAEQHEATAADAAGKEQQPESAEAPEPLAAAAVPAGAQATQAEELHAAAHELAALRSALLDAEARAAIAAAEVQKERSMRVEAQRRLSRVGKERKTRSSSRDEVRTAAQDDARKAAAMADRVRQLEAALRKLKAERSSRTRQLHRPEQQQQQQQQQHAQSTVEEAQRAEEEQRRRSAAEEAQSQPEPPPPAAAASVPDVLRCDALQQTVFLLEEELSAARHALHVSRPAALLQLEEDNRCLRRDLLELRRSSGGTQPHEALQAAHEARDAAEAEALRLRCDKLELLFVSEEARGREERLRRRLAETERVKQMLAAALEQGREGLEAPVLSREVQQLLTEMEGEAAAAPRALELHDALQLVRRAVSRLKAEAEQWRLKAERGGGGGSSEQQQAEQLQLLLRENRRLSSRLAEAEGERHGEGGSRERTAAAAEHQRVLGVSSVLRKEARKERGGG